MRPALGDGAVSVSGAPLAAGGACAGSPPLRERLVGEVVESLAQSLRRWLLVAFRRRAVLSHGSGLEAERSTPGRADFHIVEIDRRRDADRKLLQGFRSRKQFEC